MTKSKLVGRGGARPGAGRKPKPAAGPTASESSPAAKECRAPIIPTGFSESDLRKLCETLAFETLATIATTGISESARVAASRELLDRSRGKPAPAKPAQKDQPDFFDDGWGELLSRPSSGERAN